MNSCQKKQEIQAKELMTQPGSEGTDFFFAVFFAKINLSPVFEALSPSWIEQLMGTLRFAHPTPADY